MSEREKAREVKSEHREKEALNMIRTQHQGQIQARNEIFDEHTGMEDL